MFFTRLILIEERMSIMKNITLIKQHKFKNTIVSMRFLMPLEAKKILPRMVLANLLNDVCERYDTKQKVSMRLDEMYGSTLQISSSVVGNAQVISASIKSIHSSFLEKEENMLEQQFALLYEFLLCPLRKEGHFLLERLEEAKRIQRDYMQRIDDDPNSFCMNEAFKIAGRGQPLGIGVDLTYEELNDISLSMVEAEYESMITKAKADLLVFGNVEENEVNQLCEKYFSLLLEHENKITVDYCLKKDEMKPRFYGYKDISQSYITSIYATNLSNSDSDFKALRVANAIFGQLPSSLLFQNVREKNSLCYSIYSGINPYDGIIGVSTGVDKKNIDKTLSLIEEQYKKMIRSDYDDELLETSKKMIIDSLRSSNDNMNSIMALAYRNVILHQQETLEDIIEGIRTVSREDVDRVMQKVQYVTSYILTQKEG